jgi:HAE1 family hydrophobic/amphiphilic exporter-1
MMTRSLYQYTLQGADSGELYRAAANFETRMRQLPGLADVSTDMLMNSLQLTVDIDRERAAALGLNATRIEDVLYNAYGSRQVSNIYTENDTYSVILELLPKFQLDPVHLPLLYARSNQGKLVPLTSVTRARMEAGPLSVAHLGGSPSVTISFNLQPGVSLGEAVDRVEELARDTLPGTVVTSFQGMAAAFQTSFSGMGVLLVMAILVIYMVLGILYESFIHPITILSGLPSAGLGALLTLLVFHDELNLYSFVGIIMLIGIVKKNAIMMIDFALEGQRVHGLAPADAIHEACLVRFRPIMMTTMAALMGTLPIALGLGAGGEARRPLGLAVVGGLVVSQLLTLYITPVFYIYLEKARGLRGRRKVQPEGQAMPTPVGV